MDRKPLDGALGLNLLIVQHASANGVCPAETPKPRICLRPKSTEADAKLRRLYDVIENGAADLSDPMLKDRIAELKATRDQARLDAERAEEAIDRAGLLSAKEDLAFCNVRRCQKNCDKVLPYLTIDRGPPLALYPSNGRRFAPRQSCAVLRQIAIRQKSGRASQE